MSIIFGHTIQKYKEILKGAKYFPENFRSVAEI
jgi:hypothetical protein